MNVGLLVAIIAGVVVLWVALLVLFWLLCPKDVPVREVPSVVPDAVRLVRGLVADGAAPLDVRLVLIGLLVWIISPIDLIPEFIPVLGPLDDIIVAVVAMRYVRRRLGDVELRRRWPGSDDGYTLILRVLG